MTQPFLPTDPRRRNIRIALFIVILATIPFYCIGLLLWMGAPQGGSSGAPRITPTQAASEAPIATDTQVAGQTATTLPTDNVIVTPVVPPTSDQPPTLRPLSPTPTLFIPSATPIPPTEFIPPDTPIPPQLPTATTLPIFPTETPFGEGAP